MLKNTNVLISFIAVFGIFNIISDFCSPYCTCNPKYNAYLWNCAPQFNLNSSGYVWYSSCVCMSGMPSSHKASAVTALVVLILIVSHINPCHHTLSSSSFYTGTHCTGHIKVFLFSLLAVSLTFIFLLASQPQQDHITATCTTAECYQCLSENKKHFATGVGDKCHSHSL